MQTPPYNAPYPMYSTTQPSPVILRHSGLGITSFVIALIAALFLFLLVIVAGLMEASSPGGMDEESIQAILVGLLLFAGTGIDLVSLLLGIIALFQKDRKKVFAILGVVLSGVTLLGVGGLVILGLIAQ